MKKTFHQYSYPVLLCLLAVSMTTSVFVTNLLWVLLLVNWVVEWNWEEKFADFRQNYLLHAFLVFAAIHLLWVLGSNNTAYAFFDIQKKLPMIALPLVVLTSRRLNGKELQNITLAYITTVFVVSIIGMVRHLTQPDLPYRQIVPYISHIRFGLNICMTLVLIAYIAWQCRQPWCRGAALLLSAWFCYFLLLLHAYTAFIILAVTVLVLNIAYHRRMPASQRRPVILATICIYGAAALLAGYYVYDYYHLKPLSIAPLKACTANGNPYLHRDDGLIENGNYVHHYVCEKELRQEWAKRSDYPFDSLTDVGYTIYPALLRYLNGMGVTKDSAGMTHLTPADIAAIEKGVANPVYQQHSPRKMIYVLCYEYENYRHYRSVENFSMLQRFELWRNGWHVFLQHPLFGVGTGDVPDCCHQRLAEIGSPLSGTNLHTHNQYLNFLIAFGLVGFASISLFFIRAIIKGRYCRSVLFTAFLCILLISFTNEDTLETLAGITFATFGFVLLAPRKENGTSHPSETNTQIDY